MSMRINIAGQRFSYLVAESWDGQRGQRNAPYWICRCEPGNCRWATRLEQAANKRPPQKRRAA